MGEQVTYSISEAIESKTSGVKLMYFEKKIFDAILAAKGDAYTKVELFSFAARVNALYMITKAGSGHIGSSFSSLDIVSWLYTNVLTDGDRYYSSKGHDSPGLYAVHTAIGILPFDKIHSLRRAGGLPGHPDILTPGAFTNTGSLGMGISKAKGFFVADKLLGRKESRIFVLTGDGELQEGQFWESLTTLSERNDSRLVIIVDHNKVQSDTLVSSVSNLGDLNAKFEAYGLDVYRIDGHDIRAFNNIIQSKGSGAPKVIIADTIKGKGVSFMEHTAMKSEYYKYHSGAPVKEEYAAAVKELYGHIQKLADLLQVDVELSTVEIEPLTITNEFIKLIPAYSEAILKAAGQVSNLVALDADLVLDTGLIPFKDQFPDRFIECGIAEQDMVSQAGTMALGGLLPVVHSFACFLTTRPIEQIYNVCTERTKVIYTGSLAGVLPGGPGHSHQAVHDVSFMAAIPEMVCIEPVNIRQVQQCVAWSVKENTSSTYIRLTSIPIEYRKEVEGIELNKKGKGTVITQGTDYTLLVAGPVLTVEALKAYDFLREKNISIKVITTPWLNYVDRKWLVESLHLSTRLLIVENHSEHKGFCDFILSVMAEERINHLEKVTKRGVTGIPAYGRAEEVLGHHQLDGTSLAQFIMESVVKY